MISLMNTLNTSHLRTKKTKQWGFCLLLSFFMLLGNAAGAQTIANKLKSVSIDADSTSLILTVGEPTAKKNVVRWFYGKDQAVLDNGKITDIRLNEKSGKIKLKKDKNNVDVSVPPIAYLRIGMPQEEALELAGAPDSSVSGQDWYYTKRHRVEMSENKVTKVDTNIKASLETLDWIRLNFKGGSLLFMNITIAFIMFGVALGIKLSGFKDLLKKPKLLLIGMTSQFILLPAMTFLLVLIIKPTPSVAMGMILVAACPGGNVSNFMSSMAKGNMPLSISLTAISTILAIVMTPANFLLWGSLYARASELVIPFTIDPWEMLKTVFILVAIPMVLGIWFAHKFPKLTQKITKPISILSIIIFLGYIAAALSANMNYFLMYIHLIFLIVFVHNSLAFLTGYSFTTLLKLSDQNRRTITIETGIQNSGLGLILIFNPLIFNGLGGMAFIAALWGIWHIVAGLSLGFYWSRKPLKQ